VWRCREGGLRREKSKRALNEWRAPSSQGESYGQRGREPRCQINLFPSSRSIYTACTQALPEQFPRYALAQSALPSNRAKRRRNLSRTKMAQPILSSTDPISVEQSPWTEIVCWSRMQAEGGQQLDEIVRRKELERVANGGLFCWGVGNAANRCTASLARDRIEIDALFSIMKSRPKMVDVAPSTTVIWRRFIDFDGRERVIPRSSLVTSKGESQNKLKRSHFALFFLRRVARRCPQEPSFRRSGRSLSCMLGPNQAAFFLLHISRVGLVSARRNSLTGLDLKWLRYQNSGYFPAESLRLGCTT
jgi:hypothetical protein